jgi:hypothetical protein
VNMKRSGIMVTESTLRQVSTSRRNFAARALGAMVAVGLLALPGVLPFAASARAADPPAGIYIYSISRDGSPIGQQRMEFVTDGEKLRVLSHTELDVTLLGMSLYGFNQQVEEVRAGGKMMSLVSETDDDGKDRKVMLTLQGASLKGAYNDDVMREIDPALPTSLFWQMPRTGAVQVVDCIRGKVRDVTVKELSPQLLALPVGQIKTRHYRVAGEIKRELWYDDAGILVALEGTAKDGSTVRQELQQRP